MDVREFWTFSDPVSSRERFQEEISKLDGTSGPLILELKAQIARTHSLLGQFLQAHLVLDGIKNDPELLGRAKASYLLERGRTFNSSGEYALAKGCFEEALEVGEDDQKVDAIHMLAILANGEEAVALNSQALDLARSSADSRARSWLGSLLNNQGWSYFELGKLEEALLIFGEAVLFRQEQGQEIPLHIAWYSVARTLRALGRHDEALEVLNDLEPGDGYVHEEIGENLLAIGKAEEAAPEFAKAFALLSLDGHLSKSEPGRLSRLSNLAGL